MPVHWRLFPMSMPPPQLSYDLAGVFDAAYADISTPAHQLNSNSVLAIVRPGLEAIGFQVEVPGKSGKIPIPVLFGERGRPQKSFSVDAWDASQGAVVEIEARIAVDARKIYQDLFEIAAMPQVRFACIAVMNEYLPGRRKTPLRDYERTSRILEALYASDKFVLSLDAIMLVGY
jgi:hypothetical protein